MKLLLINCILLVSINASVLPQSSISLDIKNTPLRDALKQIEETSKLNFFYNEKFIDLDKEINLSVSNVSKSELLQRLFQDQTLTYQVLNNDLVVITPSALKQDVVVKGKVTDSEGNPLPGVNIVEKGTNTGAVTDLDGNYTITVSSPDAVLVFSFVGYLSEEKQVEGRTTLNVILVEDLVSLNEVVVIGYGAVKKENVTGSVSVVTADEITRAPISNVSRAIQGKASGVVVYQSGEPGGGVNMRVRGIGSITQDPDPLYVVDGVVDVDINGFSPEDIESISILKDASAAAIYGANGANGVVVITTKRGSNMVKPKVTLSASFGTSRIPRTFDLMNADEYASFYITIDTMNNREPDVAYSDFFRQQYHEGNWREGTDWQKEILRENLTQNYYLNISNGNENANYSISFNYFDEEGLLINSYSNRFNLRANSDFQIGKYIKIGETLNITRKKSSDPNNSAWNMSLESSPLMNIYNENNKEGYEGSQIAVDYVDENGETQTTFNTGGNDKFNPVGILAIPDNQNVYDNLIADVYVEINPFVQGLTFRSSATANIYSSEYNGWTPAYDMGSRSVANAQLKNNTNKNQTYLIKNQLSYNFAPGKHSFDLTAIHDVIFGEGTYINGTGIQFPYEQLRVLSQATEKDVAGEADENAQLSYIGRLIYSYDNKYLFQASFRRDGSSNFGPLNKWGNFPAFSIGWKLNEDFLTWVEQINLLKLRFGWGKTGNSKIGGFNYDTYIDNPNFFSPVFGDSPQEAYAMNEVWNFGNPVIKWEAAEMTNIGMDLNAFSNRLQFSGEYYIKKQNDLLMKVPSSHVHGKGLTWEDIFPWVNNGDMENRGWDFDVRYSRMEGPFNYRVFANLSTVKNKVLRIPEEVKSGSNITTEGEPVGSIYGYKAVRIIQESDYDEEGNFLYAAPSGVDPQPGDLMFADLNDDELITDDDRMIIGKPIPDYTYSFGFDLYYKNFDLSAFLYGAQNAQVLNIMRSQVESFEPQDMDHNKSVDWTRNYYGKDGKPSTEYVRLDVNDTNQNTRGSSWWVDDASFLRVKDLQLGYSLPVQVINRLGISSTRLYLSAMNLYTFTKYKGYDPESPLNSDSPTVPGIDSNKYPIPKVYTVGIQMSF